MGKKFPGFLTTSDSFTGIPENFFRDVLPQIDDLNLLKLCLYILWKANTTGDFSQAFSTDIVLLDRILADSFERKGEDERSFIHSLLEKAADSEYLLKSKEGPGGQIHYFINCEDGRKALKKSGKKGTGSAVTLEQVKPNIYKLYEENIGPLTPLIADALKDAESDYPLEWITEAIQIAVKNNVRRWRYIEKVLDRWQKEGRNGTDRKRAKTDYRSYIDE